ncbi:MAG: hypothetical protein AB8H03_06515 [Saprospiraceae bacterium]
MSQIIKLHAYSLSPDNSPIIVSITVGNLQRGTTDLFLDGVKLNSKSIVDSFSDKKIGLSDALKGKQLTISTTIFDINKNGNEVSYRYKIKGGTKVLNPAGSKVTVTEGGVAHFFIRVFLV